MTIHRDGKEYICECDDCLDQYPETADSFGGMVQIIRLSAWSPYKDDEEHWCHRCPDCLPASKLAAQKELFGKEN